MVSSELRLIRKRSDHVVQLRGWSADCEQSFSEAREKYAEYATNESVDHEAVFIVKN